MVDTWGEPVDDHAPEDCHTCGGTSFYKTPFGCGDDSDPDDEPVPCEDEDNCYCECHEPVLAEVFGPPGM